MSTGPYFNCDDEMLASWWHPLEAAGYSVIFDQGQKPDEDGGISAVVLKESARVRVYYGHAKDLGGNVISLHYAAPLIWFGKNYCLAKEITKILLSSGAWLPKTK